MKEKIYDELKCVYDQFQKYHMKFGRKLQCKSRERRYFQTNHQEMILQQ